MIQKNMFLKTIKNQSILFLLLILSLIFLFITVGFYYFYRTHNQSVIYVNTALVRPTNIQINTPFYWTPYWLEESVRMGDKDINPLGGINAEVIDKKSIDSLQWGKIVILLLKINVIKDRSGLYLYKNKPIAVGTILELKFPKAQVSAYVNYIGAEKPTPNLKVLRLDLKSRNIESKIINNIRIGESIKNDKNEIIAKIISFKEVPSNVLPIIPANIYITGLDLEITVDLLSEIVDSRYYFIDGQRIRPNEQFYISFPNLTLDSLSTKITKVEFLNSEIIK